MGLGEILIIVFTGFVAASTVAYVVLTWRLVSETRRLREVQTEPRVSVRIELAEGAGHGAMELVVRNEGQGPAQNILFDFEGDPTYFTENGLEQPIDQIAVIKHGLPYLGPSQHFGILLGWLFGDAFIRATKQPWIFHIDYENLLGKSQRDTYTLDFSQFNGLMVGGGPPLVKIEKHLEALQRDVHRFTAGTSKLHVLTQTEEEARKELLKLVEERKRRRVSSKHEPESSDVTTAHE